MSNSSQLVALATFNFFSEEPGDPDAGTLFMQALDGSITVIGDDVSEALHLEARDILMEASQKITLTDVRASADIFRARAFGPGWCAGNRRRSSSW